VLEEYGKFASAVASAEYPAWFRRALSIASLVPLVKKPLTDA
jgi:hypothetical protein